MIFEESDEPAEMARLGIELPSDRGRIAAFDEAVVQTFVVAIVESLLLQGGLEVPVRLRDECEVGVHRPHGPDHEWPILL